MGRTGEVDGSRVFACLFVLGAHFAFWWVLTRNVAPPARVDDADSAMQLTWIEPHAPPQSTPPVPATTQVRRDPTSISRRDPPVPTAPVPAAPSVAPLPGTTLRAVFLEQARQLSGTGGDEALFVPDPLAHKRANLPGPDNERFRMRNPPSIRGALLKIGAVVGGPGYATDPCQRVASNIGELSQLGDSALLQEELRRKRALCD